MDLAKIYVLPDVPGCVNLAEYLVLVVRYKYPEPKMLIHTAYALNRNNPWPSDHYLTFGRQVGIWAPDAGDRLRLTDIGDMICDHIEKRLGSEPVFDMKVHQQEKLRKRHEHLPKAGQMIYLRANAAYKITYWDTKPETVSINGSNVPVITDQPPGRWDKSNYVNNKDPIIVTGTHMETNRGVRAKRYGRRWVKDFVIAMVGGQMYAIDPKAIMKRRPAGQGLNKRRKKTKV